MKLTKHTSRSKVVIAAIIVTISGLFLSVQFRASRGRARSVSADYLGGWTNLVRFQGQRFTAILDYHLPGGKIPGFKPGWIVSYVATGGGHACDIYVDLAGSVLGTDDPVRMSSVTKRYRETLVEHEGAATGNRPIRSETNQSSSAAGSHR